MSEKYGVETEDPPATKIAGDQTLCPKCHKPLRPKDDTGVSICPDCGTQPFERPQPAQGK